MKQLTKEQKLQRDTFQERYGGQFDKLEKSIEAFNAAVETAWETVTEALDEYNALITDVNDWKQEIASNIQEYIDGRSEKWQESDKAQEYESWKEPFEETLDTVELDKPEALELDDVEDLAELLANLPETLEG